MMQMMRTYKVVTIYLYIYNNEKLNSKLTIEI